MVTQSIFFGHASNDSQTTNFQANQYLQSRKTESKPCSPSLTLDCRVLFLAEKLENHSGNCMELTLRLFIHHLRLKIIFP